MRGDNLIKHQYFSGGQSKKCLRRKLRRRKPGDNRSWVSKSSKKNVVKHKKAKDKRRQN